MSLIPPVEASSGTHRARHHWLDFAGTAGFRGRSVVINAADRGDNGQMAETASMINREIKCRCGQMGVISGVEGSEDHPDFVWVTHMVRLALQTHIHRGPQMAAVLAQLAR
jgi:hypothetical protein